MHRQNEVATCLNLENTRFQEGLNEGLIGAEFPLTSEVMRRELLRHTH